jgi:hypothetical protein
MPSKKRQQSHFFFIEANLSPSASYHHSPHHGLEKTLLFINNARKTTSKFPFEEFSQPFVKARKSGRKEKRKSKKIFSQH